MQNSLEWLIDPVGKSEFFSDYFEKRVLLVRRGQPNFFGALLSLDEVDRVITTLDRKYPDICLKNADDSELSPRAYTFEDGALDVAALYQLFERGATVALAFLDTIVPELTTLCRGLEREFSFPFQANAYLTPANAQGARAHYDTHDVFVLQISGSKHWTIFETPVELPLREQRFEREVHQVGQPTLEFELKAGDSVHIPRGIAHQARASDSTSLHITAGLLCYTWADFMSEFVASVSLTNVDFRRGLPAGFADSEFDRTEARNTFRQLLATAAAQPDFDATLDKFIDRFLGKCPPLLDGQLSQLAQLNTLSVDSVVTARRSVVGRVRRDGDSVLIEAFGRRITLPGQASEAVEFALSHKPFAVRELPGELDEASKVTLIRRLIREGFVVQIAATKSKP